MLTGSTSVYIDPKKTDEGPASRGPGHNNHLESRESKVTESPVDKVTNTEEEQVELDKEIAEGEEDLLNDKLDRSTLGNFIVKFGRSSLLL